MSDITKCGNGECPSHGHCRRFTAPDEGLLQSWGGFAPEGDDERCADYVADVTKNSICIRCGKMFHDSVTVHTCAARDNKGAALK